MAQAAAETQVLADVLDRLKDKTDGDNVSVGDVMDAFEDRSFGAVVTVIGLVAAMPVIGAIPGMSILTGLLILLIVGQYLIGRDHPWIPSTLEARSIERDKLLSGVKKVRPYAKWVDGYVYPRLEWLVRGSAQRYIIAAIIGFLALTMYPLAFVPWGVQAPATAIVLFGVAMMGRDGVFAAVGYALTAVTLVIMIYFWGTIASGLSWLSGG